MLLSITDNRLPVFLKATVIQLGRNALSNSTVAI